MVTYTNVKTAYATINVQITSCHVTDGPVFREGVTGTVTPIPVTRIASASSTNAMTESDVRGMFHYDYTIVRKGSSGSVPRRIFPNGRRRVPSTREQGCRETSPMLQQ